MQCCVIIKKTTNVHPFYTYKKNKKKLHKQKRSRLKLIKSKKQREREAERDREISERARLEKNVVGNEKMKVQDKKNNRDCFFFLICTFNLQNGKGEKYKKDTIKKKDRFVR